MTRGVVMLQRAKRGSAGHAGFSLIEVLFVIIIIAILCAIAIPMYLGQRDRAKNAVAVEGGRTIMIAVMTYAANQDGDTTWPASAEKDLLVAAGAIAASDWPNDAFGAGDMQPVTGPGDTTPGRYLYREAPNHATTGRHQIIVYRKNAEPFAIP
jgi:prepilin-type N-terminal cleavage/methylation domain-containing protein